MRSAARIVAHSAVLLAALLVAGCGGGSDQTRDASSAPAPPAPDLFGIAGEPAHPRNHDPAPVMDAAMVQALQIQRIEKLDGAATPGQEVLEDGGVRYRLVAPWIDVPAINADGTRAQGDQVLARLRTVLTARNLYIPHVESECFDPGFAIRLGAGAAQRTYLVCLMCDKIVRIGTPDYSAWTPNEDAMNLFKACYVDVFLLGRP